MDDAGFLPVNAAALESSRSDEVTAHAPGTHRLRANAHPHPQHPMKPLNPRLRPLIESAPVRPSVEVNRTQQVGKRTHQPAGNLAVPPENGRQVRRMRAESRRGSLVHTADSTNRLKPHNTGQHLFIQASAFRKGQQMLVRQMVAEMGLETQQVTGSVSFKLACLMAPVAVMSAFCAELFLKCLLRIETGQVPRQHDLFLLFSNLPQPTRRKLEKDFLARANPPVGFREVTSLEDELRASRDAFTYMRYICDAPENTSVSFTVDPLTDCIRDHILARHPEWDAELYIDLTAPAPPPSALEYLPEKLPLGVMFSWPDSISSGESFGEQGQ